MIHEKGQERSLKVMHGVKIIIQTYGPTRVGIDGGKPGNFLVTGLGFPPSGLKLIIPGGSIMSPSQHNFVTAVNTKCTLQSSSSQLNYL